MSASLRTQTPDRIPRGDYAGGVHLDLDPDRIRWLADQADALGEPVPAISEVQASSIVRLLGDHLPG